MQVWWNLLHGNTILTCLSFSPFIRSPGPIVHLSYVITLLPLLSVVVILFSSFTCQKSSNCSVDCNQNWSSALLRCLLQRKFVSILFIWQKTWPSGLFIEHSGKITFKSLNLLEVEKKKTFHLQFEELSKISNRVEFVQ